MTYSAVPPRWAIWAARAVPLCVLPSALWRVALVAGLAGEDTSGMPSGERAYILGLSTVSMGLALLTLGLVLPWGETVPRWIPLLGGRRIPAPAVVASAMSGAVAIIALCAYAVLNAMFHFVEPPEPAIGEKSYGFPESGPALWFLIACYAPLTAWGPLLGAVTIAYHRRRRAASVSG